MGPKNLTLGVDAGSISISIAAIDDGGVIEKTDYRFHHGKIAETLVAQLGAFDLSRVSGIGVTSTTPDIIRNALRCDPRIAVIKSALHFHGKAGAIIIVGGEKFGLISFDENGDYLNYRSNTSCAAGTGSFLDQQAKRLNIGSIDEFTRIAGKNSEAVPKIASRCAVFAKTDLIHAQQEGYSLSQICDGLSCGLAKNVADTLFNNIILHDPVIFAGGVSRNSPVVRHLAAFCGKEIIADEFSHLYGAIGAALARREDEAGKPADIAAPEDLLMKTEPKKSYFFPPLELRLSSYPDFNGRERYEFSSAVHPGATPVEVDIYEEFSGATCDCYLGVDIGSTSTKAVIMARDKTVMAGLYTRTSGRPIEAAQTLLEAMHDLALKRGIRYNFLGVGTTGSGRKFVGTILGADIALDEITAHARAACELDPEVDTIIEIGGQDSKYTTLRNGMVTFSIMNNVCAAGTGSFIEEQARRLDCPLSEYPARTAGISAPLASDRCTVFMERDINNYLNEGYSVEEALASVLHSIRENYLTKVAVPHTIGKKIFFQGATAKNRALVAAFEQKLGRPIMVSKFCHLTGALGVALHLHDAKTAATKFRGIDLYRTPIPVRTETCDLCTNHCKIRITEVRGETIAFGFLCGRDYGTKKYVKGDRDRFDQSAARKKFFSFRQSTKKEGDITIGIPAALHLVDELPLWKRFFDMLGLPVVTTESYTGAVQEGRRLTGAEFCAPITALHGHVRYLAEKADCVFLPLYLEARPGEGNARRHYCYYTQFAPSVISLAGGIAGKEKIRMPLIRSVLGTFHMKTELYTMMKSIAPGRFSFLQVSSAYDRAWEWYCVSLERLKDLFAAQARTGNDIDVVIVGRPYTVLSADMNKGIPGIFSRLGVRTFFQDMVPLDDAGAITPLLSAVHWNYASTIFKVADRVARSEGLYPVLMTSFKCSPDSFVIDYFKGIMESYRKPYLILQLDEHDSSVGYETRIEAAVRAFRNHYRPGQSTARAQGVRANPDVTSDFGSVRDMTILLPCWDDYVADLQEAALRGEGLDVRRVVETETSIRQSMSLNSGQCIPLNAVARSFINYIRENDLDPARTAVWLFNSLVSCNIRMYPYYIKRLLERHGCGLEKVSIYVGEITFTDISMNTAIANYFAAMFGGLLKKAGCRIRPYERIAGTTDAAISAARETLYGLFLHGNFRHDAEKALAHIADIFASIDRVPGKRPRVAVFGDLYVRDNSVMNQGLIRTIEENGGEVITTPYNEYMKMIAGPYFYRWLTEGRYLSVAFSAMMKNLILLLEKKYYRHFNRILGEPARECGIPARELLAKFNVRPDQTGESMENILKVCHLKHRYPDLSLFVQTSPAFCCPSLVTEAMSSRIEEITGVPVVSIEYDGTGSPKNDSIIPYLKLPGASRVGRKRGIV